MSIFRRFVSYYKPYRKLFVADIVCAVVLSIIDLSFPQFIRWLPDNLFSGDPAVIYRALRWLFLVTKQVEYIVLKRSLPLDTHDARGGRNVFHQRGYILFRQFTYSRNTSKYEMPLLITVGARWIFAAYYVNVIAQIKVDNIGTDIIRFCPCPNSNNIRAHIGKEIKKPY